MGETFTPFDGKLKFYSKKRASLLKRIAKLEEKVKVCDEKISKKN